MKIRLWPVVLSVMLLPGCVSEEREPPAPSDRTPGGEVGAVDTNAVYEEGDLGQRVYVPVYSHIYYQDGTREFNLTTTLSIRNTDPDRAITLTAVRYYDSVGSLVRPYLDHPVTVAPLASRSFVVEERDKTGGVGANFLIDWRADVGVSRPIIEAVMISTAGTQGISFTSRGEVIQSYGGDAAIE